MTSRAVERAFDLALTQHRAGQLKAAEQHYRKALKIEPRHAPALFWFGTLALETKRFDFAVDMLTRAAQLVPKEPGVQSNLGEALVAAGRAPESVAAFQRALALEPESAERHFNLALAYGYSGEQAGARAAFADACRLEPGNARFHLELAQSLRGAGELEPALAAARRSLELDPGHAFAHQICGSISSDLQRLDDAIESYRCALELEPKLPRVHADLGLALLGSGRVEEAVTSWELAVAADPSDVVSDSNRMFALMFHGGFDDGRIAAAGRAWAARHEAPLAAALPSPSAAPVAQKKLRVGYVCSVFREQALVCFIVPLVLERARDGYELYCYSGVTHGDAITEQLRASADVWRDVADLSDADLAELIRRDGIDVLVDMNMHMATSRLLAFARRPAPVQMSWGAYPGTTGLSSIDYRVTDRHLNPPGEPHVFVEQPLVLPDTFWCYDPLDRSVEVGELPGLRSSSICFGNLNGVWKLNRETAALWARVLLQVPGSTLSLLSPGWQRGVAGGLAESEQRLLGFFEVAGVAPERVQFLPRAARKAYFEYYNGIDIGLDTLPYGGHTTSCDALWMGVPVVSLVGQTVVGRACLTLNANLGLPELVARSDAEFVETALALSRDLPALAGLRRGLRSRMQSSRLMDGARFARNMEAGYRAAWQRHCAGLAPQRIDLEVD